MSDSAACIVPVAAADAIAWAEGKLTDSELLLRAPLIPEAVFMVDLPNRASYRQMLRQVAFWKRRGAVCLIARTGNLVVDDHILKNAGVVTFREPGQTGPDAQYRFLVPPEAFSRWVGKFARNLAPG